MNYLSVCSGIEAATVAWHELGFNPVGYSEIEPFPAAVLANHYPHVPNFGDMTKFKEWNLDPTSVDLLVGGTPCQSFSVAGLRKGLDDPRGNLALVYCAMLDHFRPRWFVWENVPGVLSSSGGRDFGSFLGAVAQLGYGFSYRVLDAQYFGVAQRRRRVFVVGHLGDWQRSAAVLFEQQSLRRDTAPSREAWQKVAPCVTNGPPFSRTGNERVECEALVTGPITAGICKGMRGTEGVQSNWAVPVSYGIPGNWIGRKPENGGNAVEPMHDVAPCLTKTDQHGVAHPIPINTMTFGRDNEKNTRQCLGVGKEGDPQFTLSKTHSHAVAHPVAYAFDSLSSNSMKSSNPHSGCNQVDVSKTLDTSRGLDPSCNQGGIGIAQPVGFDAYNNDVTGHVSKTIDTGQDYHHVPNVMQHMAVRRLTPVECERLQGFPDGYTNIGWRNKPEAPDGPRYKSLGNSMAVPVMRWIGERIKQVEEIKK